MKPLFFAVLNYFTDGHEGTRIDVQNALRDRYGKFRAFKDDQMDEALNTACSNGLLEEIAYDVDKNGKLLTTYRCADRDTIIKYIGE